MNFDATADTDEFLGITPSWNSALIESRRITEDFDSWQQAALSQAAEYERRASDTSSLWDQVFYQRRANFLWNIAKS